MKTEHLIFNLELIRNVQCVLKMTGQLVKPNTSTVWSPASKYKVGWASVLSRVLLPHLSTSGGDWPSVQEPCTAKGHKLLTPPHLAALQPSLTAFYKKRLSRVHTWHTGERKHVASGLWVRGQLVFTVSVQPGIHMTPCLEKLKSKSPPSPVQPTQVDHIFLLVGDEEEWIITMMMQSSFRAWS